MILTSWLIFPHEHPFTSISTMDAMGYACLCNHLLCIQRDGRAPPLLLMNSKKTESEIYYNLSSPRKPLDIHTNMVSSGNIRLHTLHRIFSVEDQLLQTNYSFLQKITKNHLQRKQFLIINYPHIM